MNKREPRSNRQKIVAQVTNEVIWDWDLVQNRIWWNPKYYGFFGYKKTGKSEDASSWLSGIFPDDRDRVKEELNDCIRSKYKSWSSEFRFLTSKFTILHVSSRGAIFYNEEGNAVRFIGAMHDISHQKNAEESLKKKNHELQSIQEYLHEQTEKEKSSISYKMHEQLGQELAAIYQELETITKKLELEGRSESDSLGGLKRRLQSSIDKVRDISSELYPEILNDIGIVEALEWYSEVFSSSSGLQVMFINEGDEVQLSHAAGFTVYSIYRDLLNHISTHDASEIVVAVEANERSFKMTIYDNGKNYMATEDLKMSVQFSAMKAQVASVHGTLDVEIDWKEGTSFVLSVPRHEK